MQKLLLGLTLLVTLGFAKRDRHGPTFPNWALLCEPILGSAIAGRSALYRIVGLEQRSRFGP
jgi:hypothetical protein